MQILLNSAAGAWVPFAALQHATRWKPAAVILLLHVLPRTPVIVAIAPVIDATVAVAVTAVITPVAVTPAVPITIERTTAIVIIPVATDTEGHGRDTERAIVLWCHADTTLRIGRLEIGTRDPAAIAGIGHVAPVGTGKATLNVHAATRQDHDDRRIPRAGP